MGSRVGALASGVRGGCCVRGRTPSGTCFCSRPLRARVPRLAADTPGSTCQSGPAPIPESVLSARAERTWCLGRFLGFRFCAEEIECSSQRRIALGVSQHSTESFTFDRESSLVKVFECQSSSGSFLQALFSGKQKIRSGQDREVLAIDVLTATPEVRFYAEIEGDRVGGFSPSSMTPGKQALFALTLILNESEEAWPLLIDQPEDDLDSRSIYGVLVSYLAERKTERQIIMVSHNANLVIGADSEQVIVANRHGVDRQNAGAQAFDYFTGSLEYTRPRTESLIVFDVGGIREHACDILDGGEDAFRKRKEKYNI